MPNTREKLIELLNQGADNTPCDWDCFDKKCVDCIRETQADHLIANGVIISKMETVATDNNVGDKWISVKDRLPEDLPENQGKKVINCIVAHKPYSNGKLVSQFRQRKLDNWDNKWYWSKIGGCTVTHWMPLPEPPKGE